MHELLVEVLSQARSAWRFRWYGIALAWVVALGGWAFVALQPDVYEASTRLYVDTSSSLRPLLNENIVTADVTARLQYVRQALLGRDYLDRIATENNLYVTALTAAAREGVLNDLRNRISIGAVSARDDVSRNDPSSIFTISYRHERPQTATSVVTMLLNFLIEETQKANRESSDNTERFLDERILEYENRLQQAEQALAEFQRKNSGRLPGSQGGYFERMQRERDAIVETRRSLRLAESRRSQLEQQLSGQTPVSETDEAARREPRPDSIDARIRTHRAELDRLLLDFTDRHPDVVAVRDTLARLEEQRAAQLRALGVDNPDQQVSALGANPVYQALQIALNDVRVEIATLQADVADRERRLEEYQELINEVPEVEAELQRLNRDYNDVRGQYQLLIQSRETQMLSQKAAEADQTDFTVLNPPSAGFAPVAPPRLMLIAAVLAAAFGAGGGLCYLLSQLKPVFTNSRALSQAVGLPVLGTVSHVLVDTAARRQQRVALAAFSLAAATLVVACGLIVGLEMLGPGLRGLLTGA